MSDNVNHPKHYTSHPSGVECITVTEHMGFNLGNAVKYLWRADEKGAPIEDLEKAVWYIQREIAKRKREATDTSKIPKWLIGLSLNGQYYVMIDGKDHGIYPDYETARQYLRINGIVE